MEGLRKGIVSRVKRVVIKIGSKVLADPERGVKEEIITGLARDVSSLKKRGIDVILVSSGAVASGVVKLGLKGYPSSIPQQQAAAAAGQSYLMWLYEKAFALFGEKVAQILLTHDDMSSRKRFLNARNTIFTLLRYGVIPVINENDTVAIDEIRFGDNDYLAALVVNLVGADLLILLTDAEGLCRSDPRVSGESSPIPLVEKVTQEIREMARDSTDPFGRGGMVSKVEAAERVCRFGVPTIIANGGSRGIVERIFRGEVVGTLFMPSKKRISSKKHWIAHASRPSGVIFVDQGARRAIIEKGKSLLPSGIVRVEGHFRAGEVVACMDEDGREFARGLANYSSKEVEAIKGLKTREIEKVLGSKPYDEVIHRDNLVLL